MLESGCSFTWVHHQTQCFMWGNNVCRWNNHSANGLFSASYSFIVFTSLFTIVFFSFAEMPYFTSPPPATNRILELGASDTITCQATGIPQPVITWYRNGQPIDFTQQQRFLNFSENFFCYSVHSYDTVLISCMDTLEHTLSGMHCTLLA